MENQIGRDNELALQIIELLKGETLYVATEALKLAQKIIDHTSTVN